MSRWLKSKINPVGVAVAGLDDNIAETDVAAAGVLFKYWEGFWNQCAASRPSLELRVQSMLEDIQQLPVCNWRAAI